MTHFLIFLFVLFVFFMLEGYFPRRKKQQGRKKRFLFHVVLASFNTLLSRLLLVSFLVLAIDFFDGRSWTLLSLFKLPLIMEFILTLFLVDAYEYFWHRLNHRFEFLWRFHQAHHIDEELDVTTALRFHPGELVLSYVPKVIFVALVGPGVFAYLVARLAISCFALFHHSNLKLSETFEIQLGSVFMTPKIHSGHHAVTERTREANYSTIFIFWDKLFKSYKMPNENETMSMGLPTRLKQPFSFSEFIMSPFHTRSFKK